jgi:hypothetical protein
MNDIDVIHTVIPKTQEVQLTCGSYTIKPISTAEFVKMLADVKDIQGQVKGTLGEGKDQEVIVEGLMLAGDRMPNILARLMGIKNVTTEVLTALADISIEDMSVVALAITEVNNFGRILRNFRTAMENGPWEPKH